MDIIEEKRALRKKIQELKLEYSPRQLKEFSHSVFRQLEQLNEFKQAEQVLAYWSMPDEVYTHDFIQKWSPEKTFWLPVVTGGNIRLKKFEATDKLTVSRHFNILEPTGPFITDDTHIGMALVPGVAFDRQGHRMGRGGGYYDRFLASNQVFKVGVCFHFQCVERVPATAKDIRMYRVISTIPADSFPLA